MKKKTTISNIVIIAISVVLFTICLLSYIFYRYTNTSVVTKVKSDDYISIDSIKRISVEDTVKFFQKEIMLLKKDNSTKDITNSQLLIDKSNYIKTIDSLEAKVYYYREKSRWIKSTIDSVQ